MMTFPRKKCFSYAFVKAYLFHIAHESQKSMNMLTVLFSAMFLVLCQVQFEGKISSHRIQITSTVTCCTTHCE